MITRLYAPSTCSSASRIWPSTVSASERAMRWTSTSVSRRGGEDRALLDQLALELGGVDEVAVVGDRQRPAAGGHVARLRVGQHGAAGRGVAGVAHGDVARQRGQDRFVEVLAHQPHAAVRAGVALPVDGDDARALLAAMLQGVEAEVGEPGRVRDPGDADDAAHALLSRRAIHVRMLHPPWDRREIDPAQAADGPREQLRPPPGVPACRPRSPTRPARTPARRARGPARSGRPRSAGRGGRRPRGRRPRRRAAPSAATPGA